MTRLKFLMIIGTVLVFGMILAGCASMQLVSLETDTVTGPAQVRQGMDIEPRLITVWGHYKNGSRKVVYISRNNIIFDKNTPGPQTVKVRVSGMEAGFETTVMPLRTLTVTAPPRTTLFKQGQDPDSSWPGLEVRGEWEGLGNQIISVPALTITGFLPNQAGRQTIRVSFAGLTTTFDVDVRAMAGLQIDQTPTKLIYIQGEPLDLTGLKVTGTWDGFPAEQLAITSANITGFNSNNAGIQRVVVNMNGRTSVFEVEVLTLSSIVLEKPPTKTDYIVGEPLDLTGILVMGNYTGSDPTRRRSEYIPIDQLVITGFDPNRIGRQQRITVTVRGQVANFFINTEAPSPATSQVVPPTTTPPVTGGVTISPSNPTTTKGTSLQFTAVVSGYNNPNPPINWSVSSNATGTGAVTSGTRITGNGMLSIGAAETATPLYVIAALAPNPSISGYTVVTVR